jgi:hypothetical protein
MRRRLPPESPENLEVSAGLDSARLSSAPAPLGESNKSEDPPSRPFVIPLYTRRLFL